MEAKPLPPRAYTQIGNTYTGGDFSAKFPEIGRNKDAFLCQVSGQIYLIQNLQTRTQKPVKYIRWRSLEK